MQDLLHHKALGRVLTHFREYGKPKALDCHRPMACFLAPGHRSLLESILTTVIVLQTLPSALRLGEDLKPGGEFCRYFFLAGLPTSARSHGSKLALASLSRKPVSSSGAILR